MTIKYSEYKPFEDALLNITDDKDEIKAEYIFARTDEIRQKIISGIKDGSITSVDDVDEITDTMSPLAKK